MAAGKVPTANLTALYNNTTPGSVADPAAVDNAVQDIVQTLNDNFDKHVLDISTHASAATLAHPDGSVTRPKLADKVVGAGQLDDAAVGQSHHQDNGIPSRALPDNVILQRHMSDNSVGSAEIIAGAVQNQHLAPSSVTADKIAGTLISDIGITSEFDKRGINVQRFGAKGDWNDTTKTGTDNLIAFQNAADAAKNAGAPLVIPEGKYYVGNGTVDIYVPVICYGEIITKNDIGTLLFNVKSELPDIQLDETQLGGLTRGNRQITGLPSGYRGATLQLTSSEELIKRYNPPTNTPYTKNDVSIIVDNVGEIIPALDCTYTDMTKLTAVIRPRTKPIKITGLRIRSVGDIQVDKVVLSVSRSNTTFEDCSIYNESGVAQLDTAFALGGCSRVTFNGVEVAGARYTGLGYGVSVGNSALTTFNNCHIHDCRHALTGRHGKAVRVNGGTFTSDIDSHWGNDYIIDGAYIEGTVGYAGTDVTVKNCTLHTNNWTILVRGDTPELMGKVIVEDNNIFPNSDPQFFELVRFSAEAKATFDWGRELGTPDVIRIKGNRIDGQNKRITPIQMGKNYYRCDHKPVKRIEIEDNQYINASNVQLMLWKNTDLQKNVGYNPLILWRNEDLKGTGVNSGETFILPDESTAVDITWGWDVIIENCMNVATRLDDNTYVKQVIRGGSLRRIGYNNAKLKYGEIWVYESLVDAATLDTNGNDMHFVNCMFKGTHVASTGKIKLLMGNTATSDSSTINWTIPIHGYVDPAKLALIFPNKLGAEGSKYFYSASGAADFVIFKYQTVGQNGSGNTIKGRITLQPANNVAVAYDLTINTDTKAIAVTATSYSDASVAALYTFKIVDEAGTGKTQFIVTLTGSATVHYVAAARFNFIYKEPDNYGRTLY